MEIDITHLIKDLDYMPMLSGSVAELGSNAGKITWENSQEYAKKTPLLQANEIQSARSYFQTLGAWSKEELAVFTENEIQTLALQLIACDIREWAHFNNHDFDSRIYSNGNKYYYYLGE